MNRANYSYKPHRTVQMMGCATCKYSRIHLVPGSEQDKINALGCKSATLIDLGDGFVKVISNCSGEFNIYPKEIIVKVQENKEKK